MDIADLSHAQNADPDWEVLGELTVTANSETDHIVGKWLTLVSSLLKLQPGFLHRLLHSAQESITLALRAESALNCEHIHILILIPAAHETLTGNWGFFRLERMEDSVYPERDLDHSIEFYLYLDGGEAG